MVFGGVISDQGFPELGTLGHIVVTAVKVNYEKKVNFDGCY
jgi:hypothetical protein